MLAVCSVAATLWSAPANAATIKVTTTDDQFGLGDGCALREAVQAANGDVSYGTCTAGSGADTISLRGKRTYERIFAGDEDSNAGGDLDVASRITIAVRGKGRATIDAGGEDRGIEVLEDGRLELRRVTLTGAGEPGSEAFGGQGVQVSGGALEMIRSRVTGNGVPGTGNGNGNGGGVGGFGDITIRNSAISGNYAGNVGGGVFLGAGNLEVIDSTVADNSSFSVGGGIYYGGASGTDTALVNGSSVTGNTAGDAGGGVYLGSSANVMRATNSTVAGNTANGGGGAIHIFGGRVVANAITVSRNESIPKPSSNSYPGGGLAGDDGSFSVENSIVAANIDGSTFDLPDCNGVESKGGNLFGRDSGCPSSGADRTATKPGLRALADNGGPTLTMALKGSSRAIGGAKRSAPSRDQRGRKRDRRPDSGAFEH